MLGVWGGGGLGGVGGLVGWVGWLVGVLVGMVGRLVGVVGWLVGGATPLSFQRYQAVREERGFTEGRSRVSGE